MRTTSSVQFYCRNSKKNKMGLAPLELCITINQKRVFINLPVKFSPQDFNKKHQPDEIKDNITLWRIKITSYINEMMMNNIPLTSDNLRDIVRTGGVKSYTVQNLFDDYLNILRKRIDIDLTLDTYRKYERIKNMFLTYVPPQSECDKITNSIIQQIYSDWKTKYDQSTTAGYMTKLKTFIRFGIDNNKLKINPFQNVKINKSNKPITYLTEQEVFTIKGAELENESLERVRDLFIIMSGTGLSYSDIGKITKKDIKEHNGIFYINKSREKTGVEYTSIIFPWAKEIIDKYDKLPVISNQKTNTYLHHIEKLIGMNKKLHCHLARHTYATLLLNKGVRIETVSKTLGHTNTKITSQYYAKFIPTTIADEVSKIF